MGKELNQIKYGSVISYVTIGLNIVLGLIYTPWILNEVGSSGYGLYTLATSLVSIFLLDFGMGAAVARFIANYRAQGNQTGINIFVGLAVKFYFGVCVAIAVVLACVYANLDWIYGNLSNSELSAFKVVYVITSVFITVCFPGNICSGILNAYEMYIESKLADIFNKIATVVATVISLKLSGGLYALVFINCFFNLVTMVIKLFLVIGKTPVRVSLAGKPDMIKEIISFSSWTTIRTLSNQMLFNMIPSVLAMVADTFAITLYGFANVVEGYVFNISQAINGLFLPRVSRLIAKENDAQKVLPLMIRVGRLNQSVVSLLLIGLVLLGKDFVHLWVGDEYSDLYYCILSLAFPYMISASQQIADTSIVVLNKVKYHALLNLAAGVINIIVAFFVAPRLGVVGVCCATGVIFMARIVGLNVVYRFVLKIDVLGFFNACHMNMLPGIVTSTTVSAVMLYHINRYISLNTWGFFLLKAAIIVGVYFSLMWLITWNEAEKKLILSFVARRKSSNHV